MIEHDWLVNSLKDIHIYIYLCSAKGGTIYYIDHTAKYCLYNKIEWIIPLSQKDREKEDNNKCKISQQNHYKLSKHKVNKYRWNGISGMDFCAHNGTFTYKHNKNQL